ncbi:thymidylate kinase [Nitrospira japonica]|uniref:Thymidylate kinase n=1 Tax=Nitrospira japonica TaxID=1325564 RepID=A0A1W1IB92_9BACT|nr:dTMP kinase [Nitrospira japonica]SLM50260.1 thymidylate kinase [Nitrospira japonica]
MKARTWIHRGLFITLEGPEGSGKTTQIRYLATALRKAGCRVVTTREPGGTPIAEAIRTVLLLSKRKEPISVQAEALLILAARSQHVTQVIKPALKRGAVVLCDRFSDSTMAYQGFGRGLDREWLAQANAVAADGLQPDLTILLDLPVAIGLARRRAARGQQNRLDRETTRFHRRVRRGFLALAEQARGRITVIHADRCVEDIRAEIEPLALRWAARYVGYRRGVHAV